MRSFWRKLCGMALGVALLPSLAGGGACLEHAVHALVGAEPVVSGENNAPVGHDAHAAHGDPVQVHVHHATGETDVVSTLDPHVASNAHHHTVAAVSEAPTDNCCPPLTSPEHCAGAAGCSVSAIAIASDLVARHAVASRAVAAAGALAPPGPARAPDVPPPRA